MLGYLSADMICSSKLTVFLELRSRKTVRFSEQIMSADKYPSIFSREMETIVYTSLFVPDIFKFLKYANWPSDDVIHSTRFISNIMKRDISASLYQQCFILCSKVLLNVLHNMSLTVLLPWQHTGFQTSPY